MSINEKKQALYNATTKARAQYHAIEKRVDAKIKMEYPELEWWQRLDMREKDPKIIAAANKLYGLCEACNILGIESGE